MAYSEATFPELKTKYGILQDYQNLGFEFVQESKLSQRLQEDIDDGKAMPVVSEKAKSEFLLAPIFRELQRKNPNITLFSGISFNLKNDKFLQGTPDFMISARPRRANVEAPIFCMVEAKNGSIEEGFAQCAAEIYAARIFNQEMKEPYETIYGAVTNAYDWVFLKLEGNTVWIDKERFFLNELPKLMGILQYIVEQYKD
ncbi:MAG: hypothetical protein KDK90_15815 [Leptospiraceae bacterium]|nr:hypothetical protein [Leptospiraceae bacterium]